MTDTKNGTAEDGERPSSPRRRPPTIDLEATEIASDPPPPAGGGDEEKAAGETHSPAAEAPGATTARRAAPPRPIRARRWRFVGGFAAGAATAAVLGAAALWFLGALPFPRDHDQEPLLAAKMAGLDRRLQELTTQLPAPSREATLEARLAALEAARASSPSVADSTLARIQALEQRLKATPAPGPADKTPVTADHQDIEALTARIATLEQRLSDARPAPASDRAVRLGLAAMQLRMAVERGSPFPAELEAVSRLVDDPSGLAPLKAVADTGLPAPSALAQTLSKLTPAMLQTVVPPGHEGGVLERLQAGAERLVRIRRIDEASGDDPAAVIARADVKATRGDIAGALAEIDKLPDKVRAPASGWISSARARIAALDAARQLSTHALQALGPLAP